MKEIKNDNKNDADNELVKYTNKFIQSVTQNLENFSYNKIIANMYEMYSFLNKQIENKYKKITIEENYKKILIAIMPVIPHFSQECLQIMSDNLKLQWPNYDEKLFEQDKINIVVQINGKKRCIITSNKNLKESDLLRKITKEEKLKKYLEDKKIKKNIYIQDKLINIII